MKKYSILSGNEIQYGMIYEAIQLDRVSYDDVYQLQVDTCLDYFEKNKDIYIMAVNPESGTVVGYVNFSPIRKSIYEDIMSGRVVDTVITGDDVLPYEDESCYWGYFSSIVVHPKYRQQGIATQMLRYWSDLVFRLANSRSIYFEGIVADAVSDIGVYLLSKTGFSFVRQSTHETRIMTLNLFSEDVRRSMFNEKIVTVYRECRERNGMCHAI